LPAIVPPTDAAPSSLTVNWSPFTAVTSFNVSIYENLTLVGTITNIAGGASSATVPGTYAINGANTYRAVITALSGAVTVCALATAPSLLCWMYNLQASFRNNTSIRVTWNEIAPYACTLQLQSSIDGVSWTSVQDSDPIDVSTLSYSFSALLTPQSVYRVVNMSGTTGFPWPPIVSNTLQA
jgi:hypothetical protein